MPLPFDSPAFDSFSDDVVDRFLAGKSRPGEAEQVRAWLGEFSDGAEWVDALKWRAGDAFAGTSSDASDASDAFSPADLRAHLKARVAERLGGFPGDVQNEGTSAPGIQGAPKRSRRGMVGRDARPLGRQTLYGYVASALAVALIALGYGLAATSSRDHGMDVKQYVTARGEYITVPLGEGSTMRLAPATSVKLTSSAIFVSGQAYFSIISRTNRAVIVNTNNASVRVLGTKFSVRQYPEESRSHVVVDEGRVMLHALSHALSHADSREYASVLSVHMIGDVTDSGEVTTSIAPDRDVPTWTEGHLVFRDTPLRDVASELSRTYGVTVRVADSSLSTRLMTMAVSVREQSLVETLDFIARVTRSHYTRQGAIFLLTPGRPPVAEPAVKFLQSEKQYGR